jgi:hypothetical protein
MKRSPLRVTIMCDNDGDYYVIPTEKETDFEAWTASVNSEQEDFSDYRVGGAICTAMFSTSFVN